MKIEKRTIKQAMEKGPQFKVENGRIVSIDGTEPDMSEWAEGTRFTLVGQSALQWLVDMQFIINHWSA